MADPVTIVGSLSAIFTIREATVKTIASLSNLRIAWKNSDLILLGLKSQLTALRAALDQIQEWMESGVDEVHHQLVMDLDVSMSCCELLIAKIDDFIVELNRPTSAPLDVAGKLKLVFGVGSLDEVQRLLERQTNALTLLITACNCQSLSEQKQLLERPRSRKTLKRAEAVSTSTSLHARRDSTSSISRWTDNLSNISIIFDFDCRVFGSRLYERVIRGSLKQSLRARQDLDEEFPKVQQLSESRGTNSAYESYIKGEDLNARLNTFTAKLSHAGFGRYAAPSENGSERGISIRQAEPQLYDNHINMVLMGDDAYMRSEVYRLLMRRDRTTRRRRIRTYYPNTINGAGIAQLRIFKRDINLLDIHPGFHIEKQIAMIPEYPIPSILFVVDMPTITQPYSFLRTDSLTDSMRSFVEALKLLRFVRCKILVLFRDDYTGSIDKIRHPWIFPDIGEGPNLVGLASIGILEQRRMWDELLSDRTTSDFYGQRRALRKFLMFAEMNDLSIRKEIF